MHSRSSPHWLYSNWCTSVDPYVVCIQECKAAQVTTRLTRTIKIEEECGIKGHTEDSYPNKSG